MAVMNALLATVFSPHVPPRIHNRLACFPYCCNYRQLGATLVMDKGGAMLLDFRQETAADHVAAEILLKLFGIEGVRLEGDDYSSQGAACVDDQCK